MCVVNHQGLQVECHLPETLVSNTDELSGDCRPLFRRVSGTSDVDGAGSFAPMLGHCPRTHVHALGAIVQFLQAFESLDGDAHRGGFPTCSLQDESIRPVEVWTSCHLVARPLAFHPLRLCAPVEVRQGDLFVQAHRLVDSSGSSGSRRLCSVYDCLYGLLHSSLSEKSATARARVNSSTCLSESGLVHFQRTHHLRSHICLLLQQTSVPQPYFLDRVCVLGVFGWIFQHGDVRLAVEIYEGFHWWSYSDAGGSRSESRPTFLQRGIWLDYHTTFQRFSRARIP